MAADNFGGAVRRRPEGAVRRFVVAWEVGLTAVVEHEEHADSAAACAQGD